MAKDEQFFLVVEKGDPYRRGEVIPLLKSEISIGRAWEEHHPDISFNSRYVSRRHACIFNRDQVSELFIFPESKTETKINNQIIEKGVARRLANGGRISIANEEIVLLFCVGVLPGDTLNKPDTAGKIPLVFNELRHEVLLDGNDLRLRGKAYQLFKCLYQRKGQAVSDDEIRKEVWPERETGIDGVPLVGDEEITTLISSLKKRFNGYPNIIQTIRGYGYRMDLE